MTAATPEAILATYAQAVRDKNVSAFMALFDEHVRIFDLWEKWIHQGAAAWRGAVTEWFNSLGEETVEVDFRETGIAAGTPLSVITSIVTYSAIAPDGQKLRSMQNRFTWVLSNRTGDWRIIHEHSSAPIDPETMTAMLSYTASTKSAS